MSTYNFLLPDISEGLHEAEIVSWHVTIGDVVKENENIVEVQTDKAVVEISAPVSGRISSIGGKAGDVIVVGETLVVFDEVVNGQTQNQIEKETTPADPNHMETIKPTTRILAAPSVRKSAREAGIDLSDVIPTGKAGKIVADDLKRYLELGKKNVEPVIEDEIKRSGRTERIVGTRKAIFNKMTASKSNAVHCTGMDEVNVTELVLIRNTLTTFAKQQQVKLTYLPFIVKAVAYALKKHPIFNSSVDEKNMEIHFHESIHIGFATDTEDGLLVPVIRDADQKTVLEIAIEIEELTKKARNRELKPSELSGGTFTISSTGSSGGLFATPIINYPEVAILGIHKIKKQPIIIDDKIEIGHIMGTSITFDHRIIDGGPVNKFMSDVKKLLECPNILILEGR